MVKELPETHGNAMMEYLLNHLQEFQRIVNHANNYMLMTENLPKAHSNAITEYLLNHPQEFQRVVNNSTMLKLVISRSRYRSQQSFELIKYILQNPNELQRLAMSKAQLF